MSVELIIPWNSHKNKNCIIFLLCFIFSDRELLCKSKHLSKNEFYESSKNRSRWFQVWKILCPFLWSEKLAQTLVNSSARTAEVEPENGLTRQKLRSMVIKMDWFGDKINQTRWNASLECTHVGWEARSLLQLFLLSIYWATVLKIWKWLKNIFQAILTRPKGASPFNKSQTSFMFGPPKGMSKN